MLHNTAFADLRQPLESQVCIWYKLQTVSTRHRRSLRYGVNSMGFDDRTGVPMSIGYVPGPESAVTYEQVQPQDGLRLTCSFGIASELLTVIILDIDEDEIDFLVNGRQFKLGASKYYVHRHQDALYRIFTVSAIYSCQATLAIEVIPQLLT